MQKGQDFDDTMILFRKLLCVIVWLGLRNDYRTLLDIQEPVNSALGFEKTGKLHKRVDQ